MLSMETVDSIAVVRHRFRLKQVQILAPHALPTSTSSGLVALIYQKIKSYMFSTTVPRKHTYLIENDPIYFPVLLSTV